MIDINISKSFTKLFLGIKYNFKYESFTYPSKI